MAMPKRNVGITGFMSVGELRAAQTMFARLYEWCQATQDSDVSEPRFMAGILVSSKTINGLPNRYPGRYPKPEMLPELFEAASDYTTLNLAHYNTDTPENLVAECERVMEVAGPTLHGFQLNVCWPRPDAIKELRARYPKLHILLQVGGHALDECLSGYEALPMQYDVEKFAAKVGEYEGCLDEILLDPSGGRGQPLEAALLEPLVRELIKIEGLGIGVAGGLSAETIGLVKDLAEVCPYLSVDAEGRLRDSENDLLHIGKATGYLRAAFELFYADAE